MSIKRSKPYMDDYLPEQDDPNDVPHYREERHEEQNDGANGYEDDVIELELADDPIGDAETEYDIEFEEEPEDDGQPSEYEEWQDYFGGDEYYDHSENEIW